MKNLQLFIVMVLLSILIGCSNKTENKVQILFTPDESSLSNLELSKDAKVAIVKDSKGAKYPAVQQQRAKSGSLYNCARQVKNMEIVKEQLPCSRHYQ